MTKVQGVTYYVDEYITNDKQAISEAIEHLKANY